MKTYLKTDALTAMLLYKQQLKRIFTSMLTMGVSLALLANSSHNTNFLSDTSRANSGDQPINNLPGSQIEGNVYNDQFSLPLVMTAFKAILEDNKVSVTWTTGMEKRLSYFVIEKSTNGTDFKEAALIFAVANPAAIQNYSYIDMIDVHGTGMLYYRIKIVDVNGRYQNSAVKLIHLGDVANVTQVTTYPNPVMNEVRITIPSKWQNQRVKYEVFSISGRLVKQMVNESANQTEVLSMQDCCPGMYVVRTSTVSEAQSQSIVKK
jgi:hypothetical protein